MLTHHAGLLPCVQTSEKMPQNGFRPVVRLTSERPLAASDQRCPKYGEEEDLKGSWEGSTKVKQGCVGSACFYVTEGLFFRRRHPAPGRPGCTASSQIPRLSPSHSRSTQRTWGSAERSSLRVSHALQRVDGTKPAVHDFVKTGFRARHSQAWDARWECFFDVARK